MGLFFCLYSTPSKNPLQLISLQGVEKIGSPGCLPSEAQTRKYLSEGGDDVDNLDFYSERRFFAQVWKT